MSGQILYLLRKTRYNDVCLKGDASWETDEVDRKVIL